VSAGPGFSSPPVARRVRHLVLVLCWLLPVAGPAAPQRVVSINLCTDELALLLARPGQLVAVTHLVKDPQLSSYWHKASMLRSHNNSLEQILSFEPDLVLASRLTPVLLRNRLRRLGIQVYLLPVATDTTQVKQNLRALGKLLGTSDKADLLAGRLQRQLRKLNHPGAATPALKVLTYYPGGWTRSGDTLLNHLVALAGMQNLLPASSHDWSTLSVEQLLRLDPDLLILVRPDDTAPSLSMLLMQHPALGYYRQRRRVVTLPTRWLSCGSPSVARALQRLYRFRHGRPGR